MLIELSFQLSSWSIYNTQIWWLKVQVNPHTRGRDCIETETGLDMSASEESDLSSIESDAQVNDEGVEEERASESSK